MRFSFNSRLMDFLNTTALYVMLNFVFILCCLPIITIGPSVAALYQVVMRETRGEHGYLIRKFFKHFKEMFIQSLLTSVLLAIILFILIYNIFFWKEFNSVLASVLIVVFYLIIFLVICTAIYVFPLMARFKNSFILTIKNAFLIAITNLKSTIYLLLIHAAAIGILYFFPPAKVFMLLIGFTFVAYCNSYVLRSVFKRYEPEEDDTSKD